VLFSFGITRVFPCYREVAEHGGFTVATVGDLRFVTSFTTEIRGPSAVIP
jgi:hypothetical protein